MKTYIAMWSGPRNISTALMRSFENRHDTYVIDEPFYGYYLKETNKNHPLKNEIIKKYPNNEKDIIKMITTSSNSNKLIFYQKHMTHHILEKTSLKWISKGINCFLIRDPAECSAIRVPNAPRITVISSVPVPDN